MKKQRTNVLILACIPAVFVLILLGTGLPQRFLPAVTVGEENYTIAEYNFYYYEAYASYVTENYDELDNLGLDLTLDLKRQSYDGSMTWAQYFRAQALSDMQEYAALYDAAQADGYDASDAIAAERARKTEELQAYCLANNIQNVDTYLTGLYDAGMTERIFYRQLDRRTLAESYREALLARLTPDDDAVAQYLSIVPGDEDYPTADIVVSLFRPGTDRTSGESGDRQWDNAGTLAYTAQERAEAMGGDAAAYSEIARAYSELEDPAAPDGRYPALSKDALDPALAQWCFSDARRPGDTAVIRGAAGWYLLYFRGWGENQRTIQARELLREQAYQDWLADAATDYPIKTHALGMQIAR